MVLSQEELEALVLALNDTVFNETSGLAATYATSETLTSTQDAVNTFFLLVSAYLVFIMQAGFAMVCASQCRAKNTANILLKNIFDTCFGGVVYFLLGYGFAFGECVGRTDVFDEALNKTNTTCEYGSPANYFIGSWDFALTTTYDNAGIDTAGYNFWVFQWSFAAAATTIAAGSLAERTKFSGYMIYSGLMFGFVYPVVTHWVWSSAGASAGWLNNFDRTNVPKALYGQSQIDQTIGDSDYLKGDLIPVGAIDFAGSGVVHLVGGTAAFWGALIVGPRIGRFDAEGKPVPMPGHNLAFMVLGTLILWFGWYGFNPGSTIYLIGYGAASARCAVTTTLSPAMGAFIALFTEWFFSRTLDVTATCNGALGGLVGITASCAVVLPWHALVIGGISGFFMVLATKLLLKLKIDDVVGAVPVHMVCGFGGVLAAGAFARGRHVYEVYGLYEDGFLYGGPGNILKAEIVEDVAIVAWISLTIGTLFAVLRILGLLRVKAQDELAGLDVSKHGGSAYHMEDPMKK